MVCGSDCQNSRFKRCRCSCNGLQHGTKHEEFENQQGPNEQTMSINDGGDIQIICESLQGQTYICFCGEEIACLPLYGYPHDAGEKDKNGNPFWLYQKCDKCHYAMALWKMRRKMKVVI